MKDETIRIRLTSEEKVAIQMAADEKGVSVTELIINSVFNNSEKVSRPIKPIELSESFYHGIFFKFTLESDEDELVVIGRLYKGKQEVKTGHKLIFGRDAKDIANFTDSLKAYAIIDQWMYSLDAKKNNPFRKLMDS